MSNQNMIGVGGHNRQDDVSADFERSRAQRVSARSRADSIRLAAAGDATTMMIDHTTSVSSWMEESFLSSTTSSQQTMQLGSVFSPDYSVLGTLDEYPSSSSDDGVMSISESLRSPGAFGTPSDWVQLHLDPEPIAPPQRPFQRPNSIEFLPMQPPSSFPGVPPSMAHVARQLAPPRRASRVTFDNWLTPGLSMLQLQAHDEAMRLMGPPPVAPLPSYIETLPPYALQLGHQRASSAVRFRMPPAFRDSSVALAGSTRRNSCSDRSNSSRGSSSSRGSVDCSYCRSVNEDPTGHNKHNCPVLAQLPPCRICGASGKDNHTETHCPNSEKIHLKFIPPTNRRRIHSI